MEELFHAAELAIRPSVVLFMAGNLLAIGLETDGRAALAPLRDVRFLVVVMAVYVASFLFDLGETSLSIAVRYSGLAWTALRNEASVSTVIRL